MNNTGRFSINSSTIYHDTLRIIIHPPPRPRVHQSWSHFPLIPHNTCIAGVHESPLLVQLHRADIQPDLQPHLVRSMTARGAGSVRHLTRTYLPSSDVQPFRSMVGSVGQLLVYVGEQPPMSDCCMSLWRLEDIPGCARDEYQVLIRAQSPELRASDASPSGRNDRAWT